MVCRERRSKGPGVEFKVRGMGHVNFHVNSEAHITSSVYSYMQRRTEKTANFRSARSSYKVSPDWRPPLRFNKRTNNRNIPKIKRLFPVLSSNLVFLQKVLLTLSSGSFHKLKFKVNSTTGISRKFTAFFYHRRIGKTGF